ncbi:MAG: HAD family hydrolase [Armatimonadota bacterium]
MAQLHDFAILCDEGKLLSVPQKYIEITTNAGSVFVRRASVPLLLDLDSIIFDVDGVLIDVSQSIERVHSQTAEIYFRLAGWTNTAGMVMPSDIAHFKLAGGFNSDWHLAYAWLLVYLFKSHKYSSKDGDALKCTSPTLSEFADSLAEKGGGLESAVNAIRQSCNPAEWASIQEAWDCQSLQRVFVEVYSGDLCPEIYGFKPRIVTGPGLIHMDRPILDRCLLSPKLKRGIATGRTAGETKIGLELMGWSDLFPSECIVTEDDGFQKPDPRVLRLCVERINAEIPIYVGDTPDDLLTVRRYNDEYGSFLACNVLTGPMGTDMASRLRLMEQEADIIADNVNAALIAIEECLGGNICLAEKPK